MLRNAKQIMGVVTAAFPSFEVVDSTKDCKDMSSNIDELACQWKLITENQPMPGSDDQFIDQWLQMIFKASFFSIRLE